MYFNVRLLALFHVVRFVTVVSQLTASYMNLDLQTQLVEGESVKGLPTCGSQQGSHVISNPIII